MNGKPAWTARPGPRRPGGKWRALAHEYVGRKLGHGMLYRDTHNIDPGGDGTCTVEQHGNYRVFHHSLPNTEFDELVIGRWLHLEQMGSNDWWMNVGGVTLWVWADRDGKPTRVNVHGPGDYDYPAAGCKYSCEWTAADE